MELKFRIDCRWLLCAVFAILRAKNLSLSACSELRLTDLLLSFFYNSTKVRSPLTLTLLLTSILPFLLIFCDRTYFSLSMRESQSLSYYRCFSSLWSFWLSRRTSFGWLAISSSSLMIEPTSKSVLSLFSDASPQEVRSSAADVW